MSKELGKVEHTARGFERLEFTDRYGVRCSLQQSSLATERAIWLGCNGSDPRVLIPGQGWTTILMSRDYKLVDTRMHLNEDQVRALIVHLQDWLTSDSFERQDRQ